MFKELSYEEFSPYLTMARDNPALNTVFISTARLYSYKKDYVVFHSEGILLMLLKGLSFIVFCYGEYDIKETASFIQEKKITAVNGPEESLLGLREALEEGWRGIKMPLMEVTKDSFIRRARRSDNLYFLLTYEDFLDAAELYSRDDLFKGGMESKEERENWAERMEEKEYPSSSCGYRIKGKLIATASLSSATKESAMVTWVLVDKKHRGQGIGIQIAQEITDIGLNENRIERLCLLASGPIAEHIYSSLGYRTVGNYVYLRKRS